MTLYVESNFVLEIALQQADSAACEVLLDMAEQHALDLCIPAFSVLEPYQTAERRRRARAELVRQLSREFNEVLRSSDAQQYGDSYDEIINSLLTATDSSFDRLQETRARVERVARVVALDAAVLKSARRLAPGLKLGAQDSVVFASVVRDLRRRQPERACFVTTNSRDFGSPLVVDMLEAHGCKLLFRFKDAADYVTRA